MRSDELSKAYFLALGAEKQFKQRQLRLAANGAKLLMLGLATGITANVQRRLGVSDEAVGMTRGVSRSALGLCAYSCYQIVRGKQAVQPMLQQINAFEATSFAEIASSEDAIEIEVHAQRIMQEYEQGESE